MVYKMKVNRFYQLLKYLLIFALLLLPVFPGSVIAEEEDLDIASETERQLAYQEVLKEQFDDEIDQEVVDAFYKDLNLQVQSFVKDVPADIKKVAIGRVEGEQMLLEGLNVRSRLLSNLYGSKRFELYDCDQCQKLQVSMRGNRIHVDTYIDSKKELQRLKKEMGVDAVLRSHVLFDRENNKIQLFFMLIRTEDAGIAALSQTNTRDTDETKFSVAFMPIISGFKVIDGNAKQENFFILSFRVETDIFLDDMKLGFDFDNISEYPNEGYEGKSLGTTYTLVPFVSYNFPIEQEGIKYLSAGLGIGKIIVQDRVEDLIKLEGAVRMTKSASFSLVYFSSPRVELENDTSPAIFQADGLAFSFRYQF